MKKESKIIDWSKILPVEALGASLVASRHLYDDGRFGLIGCLFRNWAIPMKKARNWRYFKTKLKNHRQFSGMYGVSYVLSGEATFKNGGEEHRLTPGCVFHMYTFPKYEKRLQLLPRSDFFECSIFIDASTGKLLERVGILPKEPVVLPGIVQPMLVMKYRDFLESVRDVSRSPMSVLRQAIAVLELIYSRSPMPMQDEWITEACILLRDHSEPSFTLQDAANHLGLSYDYFRRKFQKQKGVSPGSFQLQERMVQARNLMHAQSVKEVAKQLGYNNAFTFSKQFKKHVGVPPSEFRMVRK